MSRNSKFMSYNPPISPPPMASRSGSMHSSTLTQPGTTSRTDRALSVASEFQSSPGIDAAFIEAEGHTDQAPTVVSDVTEFLPFQQLLETEVTIHFGPKLDQKRTVHLELLKCYSKHIKDLFNGAKSQHEAYRQGKLLRTQVKALLPPETPSTLFTVGSKDADELARQAINLILRCISSYPLREYQHCVKECLVKATTKHFQDKSMWQVAPTAADLKKKEKDYQPVEHFRDRLQVLNSAAIQLVLSQLNRQLWAIKCAELKQVARTDRAKAAAQRKLVLPTADLDTIGPLLQWLYQGELQVRTPAQLCKVYRLAEELGVTNLAQTCLNKLSTEAFDAMKCTASDGKTLRALIDNSQVASHEGQHNLDNPFAGIVWTVFEFVLQHQDPPLVLRDMVIEAIADSADPELLSILAPKMSLGISVQLNMVLMGHWSGAKPYMDLMAKQGNLGYQGEMSDDDSVKTERQSLEKFETTPDSQLAAGPIIASTVPDVTETITVGNHQMSEHYG